MAVLDAPLQSVISAVGFTVGVGFIVYVKLCVPPEHATVLLVKIGVTTTVETTGKLVVFAALNAAIFPVPPAANPMDVVLFVQEYEFAEPVKATAVVELV
jgi:hypothetical protein